MDSRLVKLSASRMSRDSGSGLLSVAALVLRLPTLGAHRLGRWPAISARTDPHARQSAGAARPGGPSRALKADTQRVGKPDCKHSSTRISTTVNSLALSVADTDSQVL